MAFLLPQRIEMPITPFTTPVPSTTDPTNFATRADTLVSELNPFVTQANALETNVNSKEASATTAANTATTKASEAATSATNAASSATSAATSATNAAASFDELDDRYLGAKASDPTLDNDGNALLTGALYFSTTLNVFRGYNGAAWVTNPSANAGSVAFTPTGNLIATNVQAALAEVDAEKLANTAGAVGTTNIADNAVTTSKIADANVTTEKISDASVTTAKLVFDGGAFGYRNKIIGGDFTTNPWQRGTSFAAAANGSYSADRWLFGNSSSGVVTILKTSDAPTAAQAGIYTQHCLHVDVTTADASIAAGDSVNVQQRLEGFNAASFGFGQAGTRFVTVSFWHKHTKTGIHCVALRNGTTDRSYVAEYSQTTIDIWQKSTVTFPVDTSGTWLYDSGIGLNLSFALMAGTTSQTTANTWQAGNFTATANQVNNLDSTANNFKIALVQLEAGSTATAFETRSVSQEKALCRPYARIQSVWVGTSGAKTTFPIDMRITPSITGGGSGFDSTGTTADQLIAFQTTAAAQTLSLVAEL